MVSTETGTEILHTLSPFSLPKTDLNKTLSSIIPSMSKPNSEKQLSLTETEQSCSKLVAEDSVRKWGK